MSGVKHEVKSEAVYKYFLLEIPIPKPSVHMELQVEGMNTIKMNERSRPGLVSV